MKASPGITAFNSGELSPACEGRTELKQYATGCYKLENFIPMVQGPARRRPGMKYIAEVANSAHRTALMEFVRSPQVAFVLEWGDHYVRFYQNGAPVMAPNGFPGTWNPTLGGTTIDGGVTWTNEGQAVWQPNFAETFGNYIIDPNGNIQIAAFVNGLLPNTGPAVPLFATGINEWTYDSIGVFWQCAAVASMQTQWAPLTAYASGALIIDTNGNIQKCTTPGTSAAGILIPYSIYSPYGFADLFDIKDFLQLVYVQSADVIYIAHRSKTFPGYKLSHYGATNWTLAPVNFLGGPFATPNPGSNPCVYASAQTGNGITLTASAAVPNPNDMNATPNIFDPEGNGSLIGSLIQLTQNNIRTVKQWESTVTVVAGQRRRYNGVTYECLIGATVTYTDGVAAGGTGTIPPTHLSGQAWDGGGSGNGALWEYRDPGAGFAQIVALGAEPTGSMVPITNITSATPPVVTIASLPAGGLSNGQVIFITGVAGCTEVNDAFYVISGLAGGGPYTFALHQADVDGEGGGPAVLGAQWDAYTSGGTMDNRLYTCTANIPNQANLLGTVNRLPKSVVFPQNATPNWAYAAWNMRDGYPNTVSFFRGRAAWGRDGNVILSVASDFENFNYQTPGAQVTADMAINITLPTQDETEWLEEGRVLVVGTQGAEHVIQEINTSEPLGPANIASKAQMKHGSRRVRPILIGYSLLWAQTSGQKMRIMKYQFYTDQYQSEDLAALANHIFEKYGPTQLAFQQEPDAVIWMVRSDGMLVGFTFNEEQSVIAWHRHPMASAAGASVVEAVAVIPNPAQTQDDLWLIVNRTINGVTRRYVEVMQPHFLTGDSLVTGATYHDAGMTQTALSPTTTVTGLAYLEGETVNVVTDGSMHPPCVVSGGQITLNYPSTVTQVGLQNRCKLTTMPIEVSGQGGTAQGKVKRITDVNVRFLNTNAGQIGREDPDAELAEPPINVFDSLNFREPEDPMNAPAPIFNGIYPRETYDFPFPGGYETEGRITYRNNTSYPATVASIYPVLEIED